MSKYCIIIIIIIIIIISALEKNESDVVVTDCSKYCCVNKIRCEFALLFRINPDDKNAKCLDKALQYNKFVILILGGEHRRLGQMSLSGGECNPMFPVKNLNN